MKARLSGAVACMLFVSMAAQASELTLAESIERAWKGSPFLQSQLEGQERLYDLSIIDRRRRFLPNEPQIQYANNDDKTAEVLAVSENVSFPGKALAFSKLDRAREKAQQAEVQAKRYEIARTVMDAYLAYATASDLVEQQKRNIGDLESVAKSLQARYESGLATQAETIVTELQLRQQRADLAALEDKVAVSARRLKELLQLKDAEPIHLVLPDDLDDRLISELGETTADEVRARAAIEVANANYSTAFWNQLPDLTLGVARNHYLVLSGSPIGKEITHSYSVGITVPFLYPFDGHVEASRQKAQAQIDKSAAELQFLSAREDRDDAAREYVRSKARLKELREKDLPFAEALMESTFSAYKAGKLGIAELVLARKTLMDFRAQDIQLRAAIISAHLRSLNTGGSSS